MTKSTVCLSRSAHYKYHYAGVAKTRLAAAVAVEDQILAGTTQSRHQGESVVGFVLPLLNQWFL